MTDKEQIMIDGVDVSVCILRRRKEPNCTVCNAYSSKVFEFDCSDFKNCYFKQLSRKTQECETLASQLDFEVQKKECLEKECEKYVQALNNIKNYIYKQECENCEKDRSRCISCKTPKDILDIINKAKEGNNE